jgi:hypothetical protein
VFLGAGSQGIKHDSGLHTRNSLCRINFEYFVQVLGEIHHYRNVAALSGEACARAARKHWRPKLPAGLDGGDYVICFTWNNQANGNLAVIRSVGGV